MVLGPPTITCMNSACEKKSLVNTERYSAVLFTLRRGALPITAESRYCKSKYSDNQFVPVSQGAECLTRYHHDFYVRNPSDPRAQRVYYSSMPQAIGTTEHVFVEPELCVLIENMYLFSQYVLIVHRIQYSHSLSASSEAIARIYNRSLRQEPDPETKLNGIMVLETFFLHALLRFHLRIGQPLTVEHHGKKTRRLDKAMQYRNAAMAGTGQPQWAHACSGCMTIKTDEGGRRCMFLALSLYTSSNFLKIDKLHVS